MNDRRIFRLTLLGLALAATYLAQPAAAAAAQLGPLFTVVDPIPLAPGIGNKDPIVARSTGGSFVVAWPQAWDPTQPGSLNQWVARTFNSDGTPASSTPFDIAVVDYTTVISGDTALAAVTMGNTGDVAVAWYEDNAGHAKNVLGQIIGAYSGTLHARRYALDGTPKSVELNVASTSPRLLSSYGPSTLKVATDDSDNLTIAWMSESFVPLTGVFDPLSGFNPTSGLTWASAHTKVYAPDGSIKHATTVIGGSIPSYYVVNTGIGGKGETLLDLAMNGSGSFVAVFDGSYLGLNAQRFNADSRYAGKSTSLPAGNYMHIGIDALGNFAIENYQPENNGVFIQRYAADGSALPGTIGPINDDGGTATLLMEPSGDFVVTWDELIPDTYPGSCEKYAQYFHGDGTPNGSAIVVDDDAPQSNACQTSAAIDAGGNLIMAWPIFKPDNSRTLVARLITAP